MKLKELAAEIDANVRQLMETFQFVLKYKLLFSRTGIEFSGFKQYVEGEDDAKDIDWKTSLRAGKLYVREYEEEIDLDVIVLLDTCSSMLFGTQRWLKSEYASIIAGAIASASLQIGQRFGFVLANEDKQIMVEPSSDISQYYLMLNFMVDERNFGGKCALHKAINSLLNVVDMRSIVFIISDFISPTPWESALKMLAGKVEKVFGIFVRDIRDEKLPEGSGLFRLCDPYTGESMVVDLDKVRDEYERKAKEQSEKVIEAFRTSGCEIVKVYTHEPFIATLIKQLEFTMST